MIEDPINHRLVATASHLAGDGTHEYHAVTMHAMIDEVLLRHPQALWLKCVVGYQACVLVPLADGARPSGIRFHLGARPVGSRVTVR